MGTVASQSTFLCSADNRVTAIAQRDYDFTMSRRKRKLTAAEKREKQKRREEFMWIFVRGKQKRVRRPPTIDGMEMDEFILRNADPIWLHQNEMWEYIEVLPAEGVPAAPLLEDLPLQAERSGTDDDRLEHWLDDEIPF